MLDSPSEHAFAARSRMRPGVAESSEHADELVVRYADAVLEAADEAGIALIVVPLVLPDLRVAYANRSASRLLGYPPEELIGARGLSLVADDQVSEIRRLVDARLRGEQVTHARTVMLSKDGRRIPVEAASSLVEVAGRLVTVNFVVDISARIEAELALRRSEDRFERVIESAPEAIWIVDGSRLLYANPAAVSLFGYETFEQVRGTDPRAFTQPEDRLMFERRLQALLVHRERLPPQEYRLRRRDGVLIVVEVSSIAIDYQGVPAVLTFARDVTERKQIEAQLLQADRLATLGMLAGGMAHSINNPLAYVMVDLDQLADLLPRLVDEPALIDEATTRLREAHHGAERIGEIVRRMRTFSRVDDRTRGPVDVKSVLDAAIEMVESEIRHRGSLEIDHAEVVPVYANPARLEQIFLNLLVHAAQSLPEQGDPPGQVQIATRADGASRVLVEVTCIGGRALDGRDDEPSRVSLSVCRSIVSSLGGELRIDGDAHKSRFRVWLPAAGRMWSDPPPPSSITPPAEAGQARASVLVIDDDASVGNALRVMLEDEHSVTCVDCAERALELVAAGSRYDVVFCDVMMPGIDGRELFERVRAAHPGLEQRLVFMTGGAYTESAAAFLANVPNARVEKPFDLEVLRKLVRRAVAGRDRR